MCVEIIKQNLAIISALLISAVKGDVVIGVTTVCQGVNYAFDNHFRILALGMFSI